jgi:hypothetical protein
MSNKIMCPECGQIFDKQGPLVPNHISINSLPSNCAGSGQAPRNPESDKRPLWNGQPNLGTLLRGED